MIIMRNIFLFLLMLMLGGCATPSLWTFSELQQGKRYFDAGLYVNAMQILLPLAVDGSVEAQYAVGYMYYYGYGVPQDMQTGYFWIDRAAKQRYAPALEALRLIERNKPMNAKYLHETDHVVPKTTRPQH